MTGSPFKMSPSELGMFCFLLIHDSQQEHKDIWEMRYSSWKIDVLPSSLQEALCWMLRPHCELLHPGNSKFLSAPSCTQLHLNRLSVQMNSSSILHKQDFILGCLHLPHLGDLLYRDQAVLSQPSLLLLGGGFNNEQRGEIFLPAMITLRQPTECCTISSDLWNPPRRAAALPRWPLPPPPQARARRLSAREGPTVAARMIAANKANVSFLSLSSASLEKSKNYDFLPGIGCACCGQNAACCQET